MTDNIRMNGVIVAKNEETRRVTGWGSVVSKGGVPYVDRQGDIIPMAVLRDAVEEFMGSARTGGYMHETSKNGETRTIGKVVDSFIIDAQVAKAIGMDTDLEGWLISIKVENDEVWDAIKRGDIGGFSVGGTAQYVE